MQVHTGFLKSFRGSLSAGLRRIVDAKRAAHPSAALAFAGHSKGAATATLAAAHFVAQGYRVDGLYVAGSPRVGVTSSWAQRVK